MGEKANDSQSFEQEDSFKGNYMQSGNTSALSSDTSKRKPIIPTVTIPYGEEEGGFREKFRGFIDKRKEEFGQYKEIFTGQSTFQREARSGFSDLKGKKQEASVSSDVKTWVPQKDEKYEPEPEQKSMFALAGSGNVVGTSHLSFLNMSQEMIESKREALIGHHANDADYNSIIRVIGSLKISLDKKIPSDDEEKYKDLFGEILQGYTLVNNSLQAYIEKKTGAKSPSGMKRLASVKVYQSLLNTDKELFLKIFADTSFEEAKKMSSFNNMIFNEGQKNVDELQAKSTLGVFPSEGTVTAAKDHYGNFTKEIDKDEDLLTTLITLYRNNPLIYGEEKTVEPEKAAYSFMASFIENNPYTKALDADIENENYTAINKAIISSDALRKYSFVNSIAETVASNSSIAVLLLLFLKHASAASSKDIDPDGPPEDEK